MKKIDHTWKTKSLSLSQKALYVYEKKISVSKITENTSEAQEIFACLKRLKRFI